jgi:hypothetical protein
MSEWLTAADFLSSCGHRMNLKTRSRLLVIFILAFPAVLFFGFLIFMAGEPPKLNPHEPAKTIPQDPVTGTNMIYPPR